ncbi:hypothetical protein BEP19_00195 [Ammoniphilus oxalaticus]|uniref:DUF4179 domain-containing protein n=1 Tax=Ammoniphilus oxalaticus TaxID=66863 RepID=A0A419SRG5_9BACL|nr:DUF4179 domain-containing protein [Ammoniphilus oxalaticus]RKD27033.1 hypothetical protein BEP19_00195 [Ammoniphilus oxalaticus]
MHDIEKKLLDEKKRIEKVKAPIEMETKLREALASVEPQRNNRVGFGWKSGGIAAVVLLTVMLIGNQYQAVAYYGKKFFGFDEVTNETLQALNEQGRGQAIDRTIQLEDGSRLTVNGIMDDKNQLILYYTWARPTGKLDPMDSPLTFASLSGFLTKSNGVSEISIPNDQLNEIKGTKTFEPVSPFAKQLTLHLMSDQSITFPYDPSQALQKRIKQSINKTVAVDRGKVQFKSLTATPTMTVIDGTLQVDNYDRLPLGLYGIELLADGTSVPIMGGGSRSAFRGMLGIKFQIEYDALPEQIDILQLAFNRFIGYQSLEQKISLNTVVGEPILLVDKLLQIKGVSVTPEGVEITVITDDEILLDGVSIVGEKGETPLQTTVKHREPEYVEENVYKERVLLFDTNERPKYLLIKGMHYIKTYNQVIDIPIR